jgi:hypothetical protein
MIAMRGSRSLCALLLVALVLPVRVAWAGPPFVSDDPEPTDEGHFEIYGFNSGTATRTGTTGQAGIDFNYGAGPDLQLTVVVPAAFAAPAGDIAQFGLGNIQLAAKYRFLHQKSFGLDVSFFPRLFVPTGPSAVASSTASVLLPIWLEKDWKDWSLFGGGGCVVSALGSQDYCLAGGVLNRQVLPDLQVGVEVAYQSANADGALPTTAVGLGARYDISENLHLLGYVNRGIQNADQTNQLSWYASMLVTF